MNRYNDQVLQISTTWQKQWIEQFSSDEAEHLLAAVDALARFHESSQFAATSAAVTSPSPPLHLAWLAMTADPVFRHVVGQYLESLFVDPDWNIERIDKQMSAIGRARTAARRDLRSALESSAA